jgi:hypothetical protein
MRRLRVLFAVLGCLAIVAAGLPTVALAWAPSHEPETGHAIVGGALCSQHCASCEGTPCPPEATHCTVACVGITPALGTASFVLLVPSGAVLVWPHRLAVLHGLAPPPDPFPPRL